MNIFWPKEENKGRATPMVFYHHKPFDNPASYLFCRLNVKKI